MTILMNSLCVLLSIPWAPMEPKVDPAVKLALQELWQNAIAAEKKEGLSVKESFSQFYDATKALEKDFGRKKMIQQCALIAADILQSARNEPDLNPSSERPHAYMQPLVTLGRAVEPTTLELVEILGPYWPKEGVALKKILRDCFGQAHSEHRDKGGKPTRLPDVFSSILHDAWSRGEVKYNGLIDYMYSVDPAEAWQALTRIDVHNGAACQSLTGQLLPIQKVYNGYYIQYPDRLPEGTLEEAKALLRECVTCDSLWSKIFVAEVLVRVESMREEDLLRVLREEQSPFVLERLELIEQEAS